MAFNTPFSFHRKEQAMRTFSDCLKSPEHQFSKNPQDYTLFEIGSYDDESGQIIPITPISLGNGLEFLQINPEAGIHPDEVTTDQSLQRHSES